MLSQGLTREEVDRVRNKSIIKDRVSMYSAQENQLAETNGTWNVNEVVGVAIGLGSGSFLTPNLALTFPPANAREEQGRRWLAIEALERGLDRVPRHPQLGLALGGLLFRDGKPIL
jgi:hypothetical protein